MLSIWLAEVEQHLHSTGPERTSGKERVVEESSAPWQEKPSEARAYPLCGEWETALDAWGKYDSPSCFHRLEHHCADVAACFEALLRDPVLRDRFERAAGDAGLCPVIESRLTVIAFLHDFGKLNAGFQLKVRDGEASSRGKRPRPAGHISEALWCCEQEEVCGALGLLDMDRTWGEGFVPLLLAALAHHGRPAKRPTRSGSGPPELWEWCAGYDPLATASLLGERSRAWFPTAFSAAGPLLPDSPAHAGVDPRHGTAGCTRRRFLRSGGDRPARDSPAAYGCTQPALRTLRGRSRFRR